MSIRNITWYDGHFSYSIHDIYVTNDNYKKICGNSPYGEVDCPHCDVLLYAEGYEMKIGDKCRKCDGVVSDIITHDERIADALESHKMKACA